MAIQFPKGKHISIVKVGEKGQIVIPKEVRDLFAIKPGDSLLMMADKKRGIALVSADEITIPGLLEQEGEHGSSEG